MPLNYATTVTWASAVSQIADSGGVALDPDMTNRAHLSLRAAFAYLNNFKWEFLLTEQTPYSIFAPFTLTGVTASSVQSSALVPAGHGLAVDDIITIGAVTVTGTRITATAAGSIGFAPALTSTAAGSLVYTATAARDYYALPSDFKNPYSLRLLSRQRALRVVRQRIYGRGVNDEFVSQEPAFYDPFDFSNKGKLRILPPPIGQDVALLRYYRRMAVASASGDTTFTASGLMDIPADYEAYPVAWAKWHFLTDKGQPDRAQTWKQFADEGIKQMRADLNNMPDEDLIMTPGHYVYDPLRSPNSTRLYDW